MQNKKTIMLASSVVAIPLIAIIIAAAVHKRKPKSPQAIITSLTRMSSKGNSNNIATATDTSRQQNEESFAQRKNSQIESEPIEVRTTTKATTAAATIVSNNITNKDKDIAPPVAPIVVPSSKEPSSSPPPRIEKNVILSSSQTPQVEEISVSDEARMAGESLKDLIVEAIKDAKDSAKETGKRLKKETVDIAATTDSRDIQSLKDYTNTLVRLFETMMIEIRKESYDKQIKLLESYRDILQTQNKVVRARGRMAGKLKTGS
ncbi:MAG: hypothetical protein ACJ70S_02900 [Nitrososphaera sp.]